MYHRVSIAAVGIKARATVAVVVVVVLNVSCGCMYLKDRSECPRVAWERVRNRSQRTHKREYSRVCIKVVCEDISPCHRKGAWRGATIRESSILNRKRTDARARAQDRRVQTR